jgi:hypothetical protein
MTPIRWLTINNRLHCYFRSPSGYDDVWSIFFIIGRKSLGRDYWIGRFLSVNKDGRVIKGKDYT